MAIKNMPYAKRRYNRRRPRRSRKTFNKKRYSRSSFPRKRRLSDFSEYRFKRTVQWTGANVPTSSATVDTFGAFLFQLSQVPNYTEFQNLFDQFKITGVSIRFIPRQTVTTTNSQSFGTFMYDLDYTDAVVPTSVDELYQRQSTKFMMMPNTRMWKIFIRPKTSVSSTSGNQVLSTNGWVDLDATTVSSPYYGLKWAWHGATVATFMDVYVTYYFKFRCPK